MRAIHEYNWYSKSTVHWFMRRFCSFVIRSDQSVIIYSVAVRVLL